MTCEEWYGHINDINLSKTLLCYVLLKKMENQYGYFEEEDIITTVTDAKLDRGIDSIFFDDNDDNVVCYITQSKYSTRDTIVVDEKEALRFINSFKAFPNLENKSNILIKNAMTKYKNILDSGLNIEKKGLFITLGKITDTARSILKLHNVEIYEYDRINSEILLDDFLPDIDISFKQKLVEYDSDTLLGIIDIGALVRDLSVQKYIEDESLFVYNVRGLMTKGKNSVAEGIIETCLKTPSALFRKNNGINIVCSDYKINGEIIHLKKASIVNGQQTVRAISSISSDIHINELYVSAKIVRLPEEIKNKKEAIIEIAKSSNRQNIIKERDLYSNESQQKQISAQTKILPEVLKFEYITKRDVNKKNKKNIITKEEAAILVNIFILLNPNDRIDGLFRSSYEKIFNNLFAFEISIISRLKKYIEKLQYKADERNKHKKFWKEEIYVKFKKERTLNFSLYIFILILYEYYGYNSVQNRKKLIKNIYDKMRKLDNYNIEDYFNSDFWIIYQKVINRYFIKIYNDNKITSDFLRKPLENKEQLYTFYNEVSLDIALEAEFNPQINI